MNRNARVLVECVTLWTGPDGEDCTENLFGFEDPDHFKPRAGPPLAELLAGRDRLIESAP